MKGSCHNFEDLLFQPNEEIEDSEQARLAEHLECCQACRAERDLFLESWSALEEMEAPIEPTSMIRARVWEQIRVEEQRPTHTLWTPSLGRYWTPLRKLAVASVALLLGFSFGRGLRTDTAGGVEVKPATISSQDLLDPALIELASEEGYSVEIFPESSNFTPLDQDMRSALAPTEEERQWVSQSQGAVVPVRFISQNGTSP